MTQSPPSDLLEPESLAKLVSSEQAIDKILADVDKEGTFLETSLCRAFFCLLGQAMCSTATVTESSEPAEPGIPGTSGTSIVDHFTGAPAERYLNKASFILCVIEDIIGHEAAKPHWDAILAAHKRISKLTESAVRIALAKGVAEGLTTLADDPPAYEPDPNYQVPSALTPQQLEETGFDPDETL